MSLHSTEQRQIQNVDFLHKTSSHQLKSIVLYGLMTKCHTSEALLFKMQKCKDLFRDLNIQEV